MNGGVHDVERTALDVRVAAEDAAGVSPAPLEGADVTAYREVMRRVTAACEQRAHRPGAPFRRPVVIDANLIGLEVLEEAVNAAHDMWDPYVHIGSAAAGVIRALSEIGWSQV